MVGPVIATTSAGVLASAAWAATWAVRGRSSSVFAPSVWRGPRNRRVLALTFDDGPSESTPELLDLLAELGIPATFFLCGMHVRRLPRVARSIVDRGHEAANHTDTHPRLWLRNQSFLREEIGGAQEAITSVTGASPRLFRAPYGVRWPGLGEVQREFGLTGVMWTVIGNDWALPASKIAERLLTRANNGGILCLHDGRERKTQPDIRATIEAVRKAVPKLLESGYRFDTVSRLWDQGK